jgi:hypothetical protein
MRVISRPAQVQTGHKQGVAVVLLGIHVRGLRHKAL